MSKQTKLPALSAGSELQSKLTPGIQQFFNGDSIEKIKDDLRKLQVTTITECYGELDKEDKWMMIEFFGRISNLIDLAHTLLPAQDVSSS